MLHSIISRKYLQISKDLVIETRLFLDNAYSLCLDDSLLKSIIDLIKPSVIVKLQKESLQNQKKNTKDLIEDGRNSLKLNSSGEIKTGLKLLYFLFPQKVVSDFSFFLEEKDKSIVDRFSENIEVANFDAKDDSTTFTKPTHVTTYKKYNIYKKNLYVKVNFKNYKEKEYFNSFFKKR